LNKANKRFLFFLSLTGVILLTGTIGFSAIEKRSLTDSLYFTIVTIGTVGYGDIHPVTMAGKALSAFLIVCGVGVFLTFMARAADMLLNRHEEQQTLQKINIFNELFFSTVGRNMLSFIVSTDRNAPELKRKFRISPQWSKEDFDEAVKLADTHKTDIHPLDCDLPALREFMTGAGDFMVRLMENPTLHEHETFTELLRASIHLREELLFRDDFSALPQSDIAHLAIDIKRAYLLLIRHYLRYMEYLKEHYPYLFSLSIRTNPFDPDATPIIHE